MRNLIVCAMPQTDAARDAVAKLQAKLEGAEVVYAGDMNIHACIGCNDCWLKTPGVCAIKDDYEQLLKKFLKVDRVIFVGEARLGFVSSSVKNLFDRILPLATMYLTVVDGQLRHVPRYEKHLDMALVYTGDGDDDFLNAWMHRVAINLGFTSFGAYPFENVGGLLNAIDNN